MTFREAQTAPFSFEVPVQQHLCFLQSLGRGSSQAEQIVVFWAELSTLARFDFLQQGNILPVEAVGVARFRLETLSGLWHCWSKCDSNNPRGICVCIQVETWRYSEHGLHPWCGYPRGIPSGSSGAAANLPMK